MKKNNVIVAAAAGMAGCVIAAAEKWLRGNDS